MITGHMNSPTQLPPDNERPQDKGPPDLAALISSLLRGGKLRVKHLPPTQIDTKPIVKSLLYELLGAILVCIALAVLVLLFLRNLHW
jgi:hypothetical protein